MHIALGLNPNLCPGVAAAPYPVPMVPLVSSDLLCPLPYNFNGRCEFPVYLDTKIHTYPKFSDFDSVIRMSKRRDCNARTIYQIYANPKLYLLARNFV